MSASTWEIRQGDCVAVMATLDAESIDAVVCDPPYGLEFMGKEWDRLAGDWGGDDDTFAVRPKGGVGPFAAPTPRYHAGAAMQAWHEAWAREAYRVMKPGAHLLAFSGTRTYHRLACAVEDAGFEIRDQIGWCYGSGFPKSLDIGKALDAAAQPNIETARRIRVVGEVIRRYRKQAQLSTGQVAKAIVGTPSGACRNWEATQLPTLENWIALKALLSIPDAFDDLLTGDRSRFIAAEREVLRTVRHIQGGGTALQLREGERREVTADVTAPATDLARQWDGWGTALKPAWEPIVVARKPLRGTVAANVARFGTGGINVDATRIGTGGQWQWSGPRDMGYSGGSDNGKGTSYGGATLGRWPANLVLGCACDGDHDPACASRRVVKEQAHKSVDSIGTGFILGGGGGAREFVERVDGTCDCGWRHDPACAVAVLDAQSGERPSGKMMPTHTNAERTIFGQNANGGYTTIETYGDTGGASRFFYTVKSSRAERERGLEGLRTAPGKRANGHPTVKPVDLMQWLVRLVTPVGGLVLDPFVGSGTTGIAALREGFRFLGIDQDVEYCEIARFRIIGDAPMFNAPAMAGGA